MNIRTNIVFFGLVLLVFTACQKTTVQSEGKNPLTEPTFIQSVKTEKAFLKNRKEELTLTGKVEYDRDKVINYVPLVNGVVDRVYVSLGDYVKKGQNLFELRSSELSALQAELVASLSEKKIAERQWKTAQLMSQDEMLSEKELFEAEARLQQATAVLKRLEADLSLYGYNAESGTFSVKAPMDGYVVYKSLSSGTTVAAGGEVLFTIADLSSVWVTVNVYAGNLTAVKEGMEAEIQLLSYPNQLFYGNINQLSQVFDPEENVLKARIYVSNKDLKFKPEMSVVVKLTAVSDSLEIAVPTSALVFDDNRYFVIVQRDRDGFEVREVTPDGQVDEMTYIQSGLSGGESVVTENQLLIYSQLK